MGKRMTRKQKNSKIRLMISTSMQPLHKRNRKRQQFRLRMMQQRPPSKRWQRRQRRHTQKKLKKRNKKLLRKRLPMPAKKKAAAAEAKEHADKLNAIAGAATKKLNDAKKKAEAEEKVVAAKNDEAAKIQAAADKELKEANEKKATAEGMLKKIDNAQCVKHSGCKGMEGYCCPTLNFAKMHLGSAKLDGAALACCGSSTELDSETPDVTLANNHSVESDGFGVSAIILSAVCGSALTMAGLRLSSRKEDQSSPYQTM